MTDVTKTEELGSKDLVAVAMVGTSKLVDAEGKAVAVQTEADLKDGPAQ